MPSIPEFSAPSNLGIQPTEIGVESTAAAGRRLGVYGSQIAEADVSTGRAIAGGVKSVGDAAEQYAAHQNISSLARHGADVMASGTQSLNAYFSGADIPDDPNNPGAKKAALDERLNNPAAAKQWLDNTLEPMLESYQQGAWTEGGQQYAQRFSENLRTHLTTSAIADQSPGAGIAAKDNLQKTADGYATAAFNSHNLHDLTGYINSFDHAIGAVSASSPTINANDRARINEWAEQEKAKIVSTAVQGRIMSGGSYKDITDAYPQYVQPGQNAMFQKQEQTYTRMAQGEARSARIQNDYINHQNFNEAANKLEVSTIPTSAGQPPTLPNDYWDSVKKISVMPGVEPAKLEALITKGNQITARLGKPEPLGPVSHETTMNLLSDIRSGKMATTDDIYKAYGDNKLNNTDMNFLTKEFSERKTPEGERLDKDRELFFKRFAIQFDPGLGQDPKYAGNSYVAEMAARQREQEVRQKGGDPHSVYDPNSPNFFGTPANIQKYKQPLQTLLQPSENSGPPAPPTTERKAGQTYPTPRGPMKWTGTGWINP